MEPETGLLRGHTGAVRLAIEAGADRADRRVGDRGVVCQVYPRLEIWKLEPVPVTVR